MGKAGEANRLRPIAGKGRYQMAKRILQNTRAVKLPLTVEIAEGKDRPQFMTVDLDTIPAELLTAFTAARTAWDAFKSKADRHVRSKYDVPPDVNVLFGRGFGNKLSIGFKRRGKAGGGQAAEGFSL